MVQPNLIHRQARFGNHEAMSGHMRLPPNQEPIRGIAATHGEEAGVIYPAAVEIGFVRNPRCIRRRVEAVRREDERRGRQTFEDRVQRRKDPHVRIQINQSCGVGPSAQQVGREKRLGGTIQLQRIVATHQPGGAYPFDVFQFDDRKFQLVERDAAGRPVAEANDELPLGMMLAERSAQDERTCKMMQRTERVGENHGGRPSASPGAAATPARLAPRIQRGPDGSSAEFAEGHTTR